MELNPLAQIDLLIVAVTIVVFVGTYWALRKVMIDRTVAVMEARRRRCREAETAASEALALTAEADRRAEEIAESARQKADSIVTDAREAAEAEKTFRVAAARARIDQRLRSGRTATLAEREAEVAALKLEASECVGLVCGKLAGPADPEVVAGIVDRLVSKTLQ